MIYTTLNRIRAHRPCESGWRMLLSHLGKTAADDEPLAYSTILEAGGIDDTLWCLGAEPQHANLWRMYAVRCARRVQHLMTDPRSVAVLDVAARHAWGRATDDELAAARAHAAAAWHAAWHAARDAARAAAWHAAGDAAGDAARAAAGASARAAAGASARAAAGASEREWQTADLRAMLAAYEAQPGCVGEPILETTNDR